MRHRTGLGFAAFLVAAWLVAGSAGCLDIFHDHFLVDHHASCREAADTIYDECGYALSGDGSALGQDEAADACYDEEVFSGWRWDCIRECVRDNEECVGVAACVENDCDVEVLR